MWTGLASLLVGMSWKSCCTTPVICGGDSSLKSRPHFPAQTGSSKVFPFVKMAEKLAEGLDKMQMLTVCISAES